ncbi:MAG: hypothetical protein Q7T82_16735 [Armatimonadota bacterium]|nr:hypothetical protein [Armatimonadota bacterium]
MMSWIRASLTLLLIAVLTSPVLGQASDTDLIHFNADLLRVTVDNKVVATGNVRATYREYTVTSGKAVSDQKTSIATFEENVVLSAQGVEVKGEQLTLNLKTRQWELKSANSTLTPEALKGSAKSPVFISGRQLTGTADNQVSVRDGSLTTCNLPEPHYVLEAREVDVYPERKVIAKKVTLYALGHKFFTLPALSIPLNRPGSRSNLIPQVGQTQAEGAFVKTAYNYLATKNSSGAIKLDLMSRKGFGQGVEHTYTFAKAVGSLTAYHLFDRTLGMDSLTGRLAHKQQLGNVVVNFLSDYRSNSYQFAPNTTTSNTGLSLVRNVKDVNTELRAHRTLTSGFGSFETLTTVLTHRQKLLGANSVVTLDYARFGNSTSPTDNQELNSRVQLSRHLQRYDWQLTFNKRYDLDADEFQGDERFSSLDRIPELTLQSDTSRLGRSLPFAIPATLALSVGRYNERPLGIETERAMFEMNTRPRQRKLGGGLGLRFGAGFRQAFYGNQAAQYVIRANTDLTKKMGEKSSFVLGYRYQRPRGASAFRFDFANTYNVATARLNIQETDKFKLSVTSGYNFAFPQLPWQDLAIRLRHTPSKVFSMYSSTGYDLNRSRWRGLINQFQVRAPGGFKLDLGTRYDIERRVLGSARALIDAPLGKKMSVKAIAGYNGFSRRFDYRALQLTRDLHCWEASVVFVDQADFFAERGIRFNLRIKAFPVFEQFGLGQRGQSLTDTSLGETY